MGDTCQRAMVLAQDLCEMITKRTRRKKAEVDLRTKYYYRMGTLRLTAVDNSPLGLYAGQYVFIKKYSHTYRKFLIKYPSGLFLWTDHVIHIRPEVEGKELYYTSFPILIEMNIYDGDPVCYRTRAGFVYLRKPMHQKIRTEYHIFSRGAFNDNIPHGFNFCLGYSDNGLLNQMNDQFQNYLYNNGKGEMNTLKDE